MKTLVRLFLVAAVATVVISIVGTRRSIAVTRFPLVCRGPGVVSYSGQTGFNAQSIVRLDFQRGSSPNNPGPGQCVWVDRAYAPSEPACIAIKNQSFSVTQQGQPTVFSVQLFTTDQDARNMAFGLGSSDNIQVFNVANPFNGECMRTQ
jgi:hypothetical protein